MTPDVEALDLRWWHSFLTVAGVLSAAPHSRPQADRLRPRTPSRSGERPRLLMRSTAPEMATDAFSSAAGVGPWRRDVGKFPAPPGQGDG